MLEKIQDSRWTFKSDMISKHEENVIIGISVNELQSLLKHTQTDISQDLNYSIEVRNKISTIITEFEINRLHNVYPHFM